MSSKFMSYLIKNRKVALIFFFVIYLGIMLTPYLGGNTEVYTSNGVITASQMSLMQIKGKFTTSLGFGVVMSMILSYALPVLLFAYVHSKKSVDLYFALPVKRSEQLITNILFALGICFGYFFVSSLVIYLCFAIKGVSIGGYLLILLSALVIFAIMLCINSLLFLVANNLFDGIVMIASYSGLALLIYVMVSVFGTYIIAGTRGYDLAGKIAAYTSPLYIASETFVNLFDRFIEGSDISFSISHIILLIVLGVVACYGLYRHFVLRKSERAEQVSNKFFAYPFVIHFYAIACLAIIAFNAVTEGGLLSNLFVYLLLLFVYIVATFVYKRKISVRPIYIIFYVCAMAITFLFASVAWKTRAFGLSEAYDLRKGDELTYYSYFSESTELGETITGNISASFDTSKLDEYKEAIDIFESKRKQSIDVFYEDDSAYSFGHIQVDNSSHSVDPISGKERVRNLESYNYVLHDVYTIEELKILDKYCEIELHDYEIDKTYTLEEFLKVKGEK